MPLTFRRAADTDLPAIIAMLADDELGRQREDTSVPVADCYRDAFKAISADKNQYLAVAEQEGTVIGTLQLTFLPGLSHQGQWRGQIESVRISSAARGGGIGRQLLDAIRFYESLSFTASHEGFKLKV